MATTVKESDEKGSKAAKKSTTSAPKAEKKPAPKAEKKERPLSNEALGEKLLKEKATEEQIIAAFTKVYKDKKGVTDKKFITARAKIYMRIAEKTLTNTKSK